MGARIFLNFGGCQFTFWTPKLSWGCFIEKGRSPKRLVLWVPVTLTPLPKQRSDGFPLEFSIKRPSNRIAKHSESPPKLQTNSPKIAHKQNYEQMGVSELQYKLEVCCDTFLRSSGVWVSDILLIEIASLMRKSRGTKHLTVQRGGASRNSISELPARPGREKRRPIKSHPHRVFVPHLGHRTCRVPGQKDLCFFQKFRKGLADRGGWRKEIPVSAPFSYAPL